VNIRAAFLHNVADALGSVAVIVAGTLIILYDWRLVDPLVTLMIAGYILWLSFAEIGSVIRILMLGSPPGIDTNAVLDRMRSIEGVDSVHHLHVWQMMEHENAVEAHLVISAGEWGNADRVKARVKARLAADFCITHSTLEMECSAHACPEPDVIGHPSNNGDHRHAHGHDH
jgi:cobalt-zinc-cadmium efflux system protein